MTRKRPGKFSRVRLAIVVLWIALACVFLRTCYVHQSKSTGTVLSPFEQAREHPKPRPVAPPKVKIEVHDYKIENIDKYRFKITFRVINVGKKAANGVNCKVLAWVGGSYDPDRGKDILLDDPVLKKGKYEYIGRLEPGQSTVRTIEFYQTYGYLPGIPYGDLETNMEKFEFTYTEDPEPTPGK